LGHPKRADGGHYPRERTDRDDGEEDLPAPVRRASSRQPSRRRTRTRSAVEHGASAHFPEALMKSRRSAFSEELHTKHLYDIAYHIMYL
jgi:hypothetical protein